MTFQTDAPLVSHATQPVAKRMDFFMPEYMPRTGEPSRFDMSPEYQRGDVWSTAQRVELMKSLFSGLPTHAIVLNDRYGSKGWERTDEGLPVGGFDTVVIDGKQRLTTVAMWLTDKLLLPASWFHREHIEETHVTDDGDYVSFSGLAIGARGLYIGRNPVSVVTVQLDSVEDEAALYVLLNMGGVAHTDTELDAARTVATRQGE